MEGLAVVRRGYLSGSVYVFHKLSLNRPGVYHFYLYSQGALAEKYVNVVEKEGFEIWLENPENISLGGSFLLNVSVRNLLNGVIQANKNRFLATPAWAAF